MDLIYFFIRRAGFMCAAGLTALLKKMDYKVGYREALPRCLYSIPIPFRLIAAVLQAEKKFLC